MSIAIWGVWVFIILGVLVLLERKRRRMTPEERAKLTAKPPNQNPKPEFVMEARKVTIPRLVLFGPFALANRLRKKTTTNIYKSKEDEN